MRRALALVLVAGIAFADPPKDAPVNTTTVTLTEHEMDMLVNRLARFEAEAEACKEEVKKAPVVPVWVAVVVGVLAVGAGVGVGYGVAKARQGP